MSKETLEDKKKRNIHRNNINLEENNPCLREHRASLKCMDENGYNQDKCEEKFSNYRACMGFWNKIKSERRRKGITPILPPVEERAAYIKEHYG